MTETRGAIKAHEAQTEVKPQIPAQGEKRAGRRWSNPTSAHRQRRLALMRANDQTRSQEQYASTVAEVHKLSQQETKYLPPADLIPIPFTITLTQEGREVPIEPRTGYIQRDLYVRGEKPGEWVLVQSKRAVEEKLKGNPDWRDFLPSEAQRVFHQGQPGKDGKPEYRDIYEYDPDPKKGLIRWQTKEEAEQQALARKQGLELAKKVLGNRKGNDPVTNHLREHPEDARFLVSHILSSSENSDGGIAADAAQEQQENPRKNVLLELLSILFSKTLPEMIPHEKRGKAA